MFVTSLAFIDELTKWNFVFALIISAVVALIIYLGLLCWAGEIKSSVVRIKRKEIKKQTTFVEVEEGIMVVGIDGVSILITNEELGR
jgi:hypothetical protein